MSFDLSRPDPDESVLEDLSGGAAAPAYAFRHAMSFVGTPLLLGGVVGLRVR